MRRSQARVESLVLLPDGAVAHRLRCRPGAAPRPGQAALALRPGDPDPLRTTLFALDHGPDGFLAEARPAPAWQPGETLDLLGPLGQGFDPPRTAARWLLAAFGRSPERVLALAPLGLARGAAIALWSPFPAAQLHRALEVVHDLPAAAAWADYLAVDIEPALPERLREVSVQLSGAESAGAFRLPPAAQALFAPDLACGLGVCGACAVGAGRRWRRACVEGPVFDLRSLL